MDNCFVVVQFARFGKLQKLQLFIKNGNFQLILFLVSAVLVQSARLLQWLVFFVRPQTSPCMYHFLVQTSIGLRVAQRSRVRVPALARNFFEHFRKRTRLKGPSFQFFLAL